MQKTQPAIPLRLGRGCSVPTKTEPVAVLHLVFEALALILCKKVVPWAFLFQTRVVSALLHVHPVECLSWDSRMLGCYDALQKKYLRMIVLAVYTHPEDPQTITECYHFKFKYTHNGPLLNFSSKSKGSDSPIACADTKKASILLIRKIYVLMQNLGPLPNDVCLTMKLFYYDEVTPPDYQPPGFKEGECEGMIFEGEPMHLSMGEVPTPFHMLKVKVTTDKQRMENADESILKQGDTDQPLQVLRVDRDDPEENQHMDEDPVLDNKVEDDDNRVNTLEAQEPGVPGGGDEVTKAGENRSVYVSNRQVWKPLCQLQLLLELL
eukprot:XP_027300336.1 HORMA domain-containing protein 1 isoform X3 [Anas platyrhynchos]